jgi:hypothetical protein
VKQIPTVILVILGAIAIVLLSLWILPDGLGVFAAVPAAIGAVAYLSYMHEKKRTAALANECLRIGFNFQPVISQEQIPTFGTFRLFNRGDRRKGWNLMTGKADGVAVLLFDYLYTARGGQNWRTWKQTVAVFPEASGLPDFLLSSEHWWDKIGDIFGHKNINFEASPDFSKHYLLKGPDESAIRAAFGAEALWFFEQHPGWSVEAKDGKLAIYRIRSRPKPEEMQTFIAEIGAVRRALVH